MQRVLSRITLDRVLDILAELKAQDDRYLVN